MLSTTGGACWPPRVRYSATAVSQVCAVQSFDRGLREVMLGTGYRAHRPGAWSAQDEGPQLTGLAVN
jgi:hypothetical protein